MNEVWKPARRGFRRGRRNREEGIRLPPSRLRSISVRGLAVRFAVGAAISIIGGLIADQRSLVVGGLFLAVPAVLAATLTRAPKVVGVAGLIGFAGWVWGLAVTLPAWLALVIAVVAWVAIADILYLVFRRRSTSRTRKTFVLLRTGTRRFHRNTN
ncbi:hypothetical protein [Herbidospora sp. RD11066]